MNTLDCSIMSLRPLKKTLSYRRPMLSKKGVNKMRHANPIFMTHFLL